MLIELLVVAVLGQVGPPLVQDSPVHVVASIQQGDSPLAVELVTGAAPGTSLTASGAAAAAVLGAWGRSGPGPTPPDQTLTTTVIDPKNPGEPWVVTTYRKSDESMQAFIKRHQDMVEQVRGALA